MRSFLNGWDKTQEQYVKKIEEYEGKKIFKRHHAKGLFSDLLIIANRKEYPYLNEKLEVLRKLEIEFSRKIFRKLVRDVNEYVTKAPDLL